MTSYNGSTLAGVKENEGVFSKAYIRGMGGAEIKAAALRGKYN